MADEEFQIEEIMDYIESDIGEMYLVKWVGYKRPTWEPRANLTNCQDLVATFHTVGCRSFCKQGLPTYVQMLRHHLLTGFSLYAGYFHGVEDAKPKNVSKSQSYWLGHSDHNGVYQRNPTTVVSTITNLLCGRCSSSLQQSFQ